MTGNEQLVFSGGRNNFRFRDLAIQLAKERRGDKPVVVFDKLAASTTGGYTSAKELVEILKSQHGITALPLAHKADGRLPIADEAQELAATADLWLAGGGSTKLLRQRWDAYGITATIRKRVAEGDLVAGGASAGALIWFDNGFSDSHSYEVREGERWQYAKVRGLGILSGVATVHYENTDVFERDRGQAFRDLLYHERGNWRTAVALETNAAIVCQDGISRAVQLAEDNNSVYSFMIGSCDLAYRQIAGERISALSVASA